MKHLRIILSLVFCIGMSLSMTNAIAGESVASRKVVGVGCHNG